MSRKKQLLTLWLLIFLAILTALLGAWQVGRALEKKVFLASLQDAQRLPAVDLNDWLNRQASNQSIGIRGQKARSIGSLDLEGVVWVSPRTQGGMTGSWWIVPMKLETSTGQIFVLPLVLGWSLDSHRENIKRDLEKINQKQVFSGQVLPKVPSFYLLEKQAEKQGFGTSWLNFDFNHYQAIWQKEKKEGVLLPFFLQVENTGLSSALLPIDSVGSQYLTPEKHYGYAATWFSFAVIAGGFWVVLLRRYRKEKKST